MTKLTNLFVTAVLLTLVSSEALFAQTKKYRFTGDLLQERLRDVSVLWEKPEPLQKYVFNLSLNKKKRTLKIKGDPTRFRVGIFLKNLITVKRNYLHPDGCIRKVDIVLKRQTGRVWDATFSQSRTCDPNAPHNETPTQSWIDFQQTLLETLPEGATSPLLNHLDRDWSYRYIGTMHLKRIRSKRKSRR